MYKEDFLLNNQQLVDMPLNETKSNKYIYLRQYRVWGLNDCYIWLLILHYQK